MQKRSARSHFWLRWHSYRKGSKLLSGRCTFCTEAVAQRLSDKNAVSMEIWTDWLCYLRASKIFSPFSFPGSMLFIRGENRWELCPRIIVTYFHGFNWCVWIKSCRTDFKNQMTFTFRDLNVSFIPFFIFGFWSWKYKNFT